MKKVSLKMCKELIKKHFPHVSSITYLYDICDICEPTDTGRAFIIVTNGGFVKHVCIWSDNSMCITNFIQDNVNDPRWITNDYD